MPCLKVYPIIEALIGIYCAATTNLRSYPNDLHLNCRRIKRPTLQSYWDYESFWARVRTI